MPMPMPMPGSWFYRLRRKRGAGRASADGPAAELASEPPGSDRALAANRASYYVPSGDRPGGTSKSKGGGHGIGSHGPKVRDTRFPRSPRQQQHADIVFDVDRSSFGLVKKSMPMPMPMPMPMVPELDLKLRPMPMPTLPELDLKLRPILTRPAANSISSEAPPPRARRKLSGGGKRRPAWRRWLRESVVVVKESADPEEDFLASMAEMMAMAAAADDGGDRGLEELLACYLALNAADHHRAIIAAFRRALLAPPHLHATIGHDNKAANAS